jgi:hypothetical protein
MLHKPVQLVQVNIENRPPINKADLQYTYKRHVCTNGILIRTNPNSRATCSYAQPHMCERNAFSAYRHMWDISLYLSRL